MQPGTFSIKLVAAISFFWITCLVQGEPTWVSSNIPSSENHLQPLGIATPTSGELLAVYYMFRLPNGHVAYAAVSNEGTWETNPLPPERNLAFSFFSDRLAVFDRQGTPHAALVHSSQIEYATKIGGVWTKEHAAWSITRGFAMSADGLNQPHMSYVEKLGGFDVLYHGVRHSGVWSFVSVDSVLS